MIEVLPGNNEWVYGLYYQKDALTPAKRGIKQVSTKMEVSPTRKLDDKGLRTKK